MTILVGATCLGLVAIYFALRLFRQWRLAREGFVVRGRVVQKKFFSGEKSDSPAGVIRYEFFTPRGEYVKKSVVVGEAVLINCDEGASIDVVYLKDYPRISEIKHTVDMTRAYLNLPPLSAAG